MKMKMIGYKRVSRVSTRRSLEIKTPSPGPGNRSRPDCKETAGRIVDKYS